MIDRSTGETAATVQLETDGLLRVPDELKDGVYSIDLSLLTSEYGDEYSQGPDGEIILTVSTKEAEHGSHGKLILITISVIVLVSILTAITLVWFLKKKRVVEVGTEVVNQNIPEPSHHHFVGIDNDHFHQGMGNQK